MTALPLSYDWLRTLEPQLKELDQIPLTGNSPAFAWDQFSEHLRQVFELNNFTIQPGEIAWKTHAEINQGSTAYHSVCFTVPPLKGKVYWILPKQAVSYFIHLLLTPQIEEAPSYEEGMQQSFFHFMALEAVSFFTKFSKDKTLLPLICEEHTFPNEDALCWDISLQFTEQFFRSYLILSPIFRQSWVTHFARQDTSSILMQRMHELVAIIVHVEIGYTYLTIENWKKIELADFIILDHCSLDIDRLEGKVLLLVNGKQAFRAKLKEGQLKILEFPSLHEVHTPMAKEPEDEDEISDLDFMDESFEEFEDENLYEIDDSFKELDEEVFVEDDLVGKKTQEMPTVKAEAQKQSPLKTSEKKPQMVAAQEVPMKITVEIGSIQLPLEKLLQLEPGNLLDTDFHPENGVVLTLNGIMIGKGELLRIGETIGVRVLELGK